MATPTNTQVNGKAQNSAAKTETTEKVELSNYVVSTPESKKPLSITERISKFHEMEELLEKRELVAEAIENLSNFYIAPTGGASIKLQDSKGKIFAIAHPSVIGEIVSLSKNKLETELSELDSKFMF